MVRGTTAVAVDPEVPASNGSTENVHYLTAAEILAAVDNVTEVVQVPEWGGAVRVRGMTGYDRDAFERALVNIRGKDVDTNWTNLRAKLISRTVVDEDERLLFKETDVVALGRKSAKALDRVFEVSQRLSGIGQTDVEELTAALKDAPSEGSGSD
jgi:hypothetical protein